MKDIEKELVRVSRQRLQSWLSSPYFDEDTKHELESIGTEDELVDRFYQDLQFGTGGLRGVMGAGINRMNRYVVRRISYGLARYLMRQQGGNAGKRGVVIAYDTRVDSMNYAIESAQVLCACGVRTYLFDTPTPTPVLSFAVPYLGCIAGIVITASHNPKEYNGYKVYDEYGVQLVPQQVENLVPYIDAVTDFESIPLMEQKEAIQSNLLEMVGAPILDMFLQTILSHTLFDDEDAKQDLKIVYTPLDGTGNEPVHKALGMAGFTDVSTVPEQQNTDGRFPTLRSPNPEEKDALSMAIDRARKWNADLVLGTDPDCDRVGAAVLDANGYTLLTGNQIGALLVAYVLSHQKRKGLLSEKSTLIKTIVTNDLGAEIARSYGLQVVETLTGFKYIGEKIHQFEQSQQNDFVFGYEESYGYLVGTYAHDKDAVVAAVLLSELAAESKKNGETLLDRLDALYQEFGYYLDSLDSFTLHGVEGAAKIAAIMQVLRCATDIPFPDTVEIRDYNKGLDGLPSSDVIKYIFADGSWLAARPSGTEPKIKFYYSIRAKDREQAVEKLQKMQSIVKKLVNE